MQPFVFNKIYSKVENNSLHLYFVNINSSRILHFNEFSFYLIENIKLALNHCNVIDYQPLGYYDNLSIISIRESESEYFIKMNNGDIFQIFFMFDDENTHQQLAIFNEKMTGLTPLGLTIYEAAKIRFEEAYEIEVKVDKSINLELLKLYDSYNGDLSLINEPWFPKNDKKVLMSFEISILDDYIENLYFIKSNYLSKQLRFEIENKINELEKFITNDVVNILRSRILNN